MRFSEIARIDELAGAKVYNPEKITSLAQLEEFMAQFGFHKLGGGEYSSVFENPKLHEVVKIYNDACYDNFIAFCKANRDNPRLPRFKGNSVRLRPDARMIRIERLSPITMKEYHSFMGMVHLAVERTSPKYDPEMDFWDVPPEDQDMVDTLIQLRKTKGSCVFDMNPGNVMKRGSTFVIVDPYASGENGWATNNR